MFPHVVIAVGAGYTAIKLYAEYGERLAAEYGGFTRRWYNSSASSTSTPNTVEDHPASSSSTLIPNTVEDHPASSSSTLIPNTVEDHPAPSTNRVSTPPALSSSVISDGSSTETNTTTPTYEILENIDLVPGVLKKPLSPSTYKDHFASLLYAEDYYVEKWSNFSLSNVTLQLHKAALYENPKKTKKPDKLLVCFKIDSIPERRPYLLTRDFVFVRPSGGTLEPFKGILHRVVKNTLVLVEFKKDFHSQHHPNREYDVSFSFNRVCLKRYHKAIETAATKSSLLKYLFPDNVTTFSSSIPSSSLIASHQSLIEKEAFAILHVRDLKGAPPYLIDGPPSVTFGKLSGTGKLIQHMVLEIIRSSTHARVLVCAPINNTCDVLMRSLKREIPESDIFRANAAFRELEGVPDDILSSCSYEGKCFTCPSRKDLKSFKVIISTFVSSFRLNTVGITAGHFSHIFMVDASSSTEPETMVTLANLVGKKTAVVVTGTVGNFPLWVRSDTGRKCGLQISYFERLFKM